MNFAKKLKIGLKAALVSSIVVPAMGVVAHFVSTDALPFNDASLAHRFECAYKLKPNPDHKTYVAYDYKEPGTYHVVEDAETGQLKYWDNANDLVYDESWIEPDIAYDKICVEEKYCASPFITYPLHLLVAGLAYARMRRRDANKAIMAQRQKSR